LRRLDKSFKLEDSQEKKLQDDIIQQQQNQFDELTTSLKTKLVSKSLFNKEQNTQKRHQLLQQLLIIQEKIVRLQLILTSEGNIFVLHNELKTIKEQLSKKLTVTDFNNLYRIQTELIKSQLELAKMQNKQQQVLVIVPKEKFV
jgi:hypothetical protein